MENNQEKSQEEMVKEAVEEAKKSAGEQPEGEPGEDQAEEENAKEASEDEEVSDNEEEEPDEEQEPDEEDEDKKSGKKLFGKKNKKDKKDEKIEELTDRLTRQMAEFDNFRKRTEKEKSQMYEIGAKDIIEKMLPVVDNFERGLDAVKEEDKEDPFIQGMEMVYKQLMTVLGELGVKPIEAVGKEFDPNFHNAVMHVEDENFGENIIAEEFQKGYMYRDSVVRHSMVKVAN
ncbi:nucleotide exchange factor GrpE [[Clostridium] scindens]|uniref:nucleotide exchange factor GrpE n=1 Tax=Clostridium scindens (strain JCM 10418 / VPI 12708) TaxID=29347 RepID=UPI003AB5DB69